MRQRIDNESAVQLALSTCCVVTAVTIYEQIASCCHAYIPLSDIFNFVTAQ
jgi:hypothetical protein